MRSILILTFILASFPYAKQFSSQDLRNSSVQEKPILLLYYTPWCPYCQKVLNYLDSIQKTLPKSDLQKKPKEKENLKKIGGKEQVPCLIINGKALYESNDIIIWISQNKQYLDSI